MRKLMLLITFFIFLCGCRCRSDLEIPPGHDAGVVSPQAPVARWCRACARRNFLSCKRVSAIGNEDEVRRQAELEACRDIGFSEAECTPDKIRFVECGTE